MKRLLGLPKLFKPAVMDGIKSIGCQILQGEEPFPHDFLLQEQDLMKMDETFLRITNEQDFQKKFGKIPSVMKVYAPNEKQLRRLGIILPLHLPSNSVIPLPLILDTGAPESLYLGTGAFHILEKAELIKKVTGVLPYRLLGTLHRGKKYIEKPFVDCLPIRYEANIRGDVRLNILGLSALDKLDIIHY